MEKPKLIKYRFNDLEFRTRNTTGEIVKWAVDDSHCWTVVLWVEGVDGHHAEFVESRFMDCNMATLFKLLIYGQKHFNTDYDDDGD